MAVNSPRILNLLLDHAIGKPPEHIQQEGWYSLSTQGRTLTAQDAEVVDGEQKSLPEGEKE